VEALGSPHRELDHAGQVFRRQRGGKPKLVSPSSIQDFVEVRKVQYAESQTSEKVEALELPVAIQHYGYSFALLCTFLFLLLPIWSVRYPGMVDYHNHLARTFILAHYKNVQVFQDRYLVNHDPKPNLAMDAVVVPLANVLDVETAGKLFLSLMALVWCAGCVSRG
jgi:hypothetical protein